MTGNGKRITVLTLGSRGDVQPYVALAKGLQAAGHDVLLAAHKPFEGFVHDHGLQYYPLAADPRAMLEEEAGRTWLETGRNAVAFMRRLKQVAVPALGDIIDGYWHACQDSDLILFPILPSAFVLSISEKLGIPAYPAYLQHVHATAAYPSSMATPVPWLGGTYNRLSYAFGEQLFWQFMRRQVNQWRRQILGLPPYPLRGPYRKLVEHKQPTLYGFSSHVLPKPPEWGDEVHLSGYWFLDAQEDWQPPAVLSDFLASGPAPVYIGFGSMTTRNPEAMAAMAVSALERTGQRGILLGGWGGLGQIELPETILRVDSAPHTWLLPRMAAVVHHGGAGTTAAGLRAGVPSILTPFFGDQFFWGWRVADLGVGPQSIPQRRLTVARLASAIEEALGNQAMRERAAALGQCIRQEDGVGRAVAVIEGWAG